MLAPMDAILDAGLFLDAFNERDFEAMRAIVTDHVELRTSDRRVWRGIDGARELLDVARDMEMRLIPLHRGEHAAERDGFVWVEKRVREVIGRDDHERVADFEIGARQVASFALRRAA
jgi:hypothetical protein